jgi:drug/metabolite transporter (DMT)-like permease
MVFAMLIWGASWPSGKIVGEYGNPNIIMVWRFIFATISIAILMSFLKIKLQRPESSLKYIIIAAFCLIAYNYNYLKGTQIGIASLGGVIVPTLSPIITYLIAANIFNKKIYKKDFLGICLGVLGGLILIRIWEINILDLISSGNIYFILAALSWSIITICTQKSKEDLHFLNFSLWLYMLSFLFSFIFAPWKELIKVMDHDITFWVHFLIISVGAIGFGTTIFFLATMRIGSEKSSSFMYIVPTSAIGLSIVLLGETLAFSTILGGALTISAVYLINQGK